jgi:uncharacterized protein YqeY
MLEDKLEQAIKAALLAGDSTLVMTLRGLKAALLNAKVAAGTRGSSLSDEAVITVLAKESKKRQESADLYRQGGNQERAEAELREKAVIDDYLPEQLSEEQVAKIVNEVIASSGASDTSAMGQVIGQVKSKTGPSADGSMIARLVKEKLQ